MKRKQNNVNTKARNKGIPAKTTSFVSNIFMVISLPYI